MVSVAAGEGLGTVIGMIQPPRTTTRTRSTSKPPTRTSPAVLRSDVAELPASVATPHESNFVWDELAALGSTNPYLSSLVETARGLATTGELMDNSIRSYAVLWRAFVKWCEGAQLISLPATTGTVLLYVAWRASQGRSVATVNSDMSAIRSYHLRAGFTNPADHDLVARARQGVKRLRAAEGTTTTKAHPLTLDEVLAMVDCLDRLSFRRPPLVELLRIRLKAVLTVAWFTGRRLDEMARAELVWLKQRDGVLYLESNRQKMKRDGFSTPIEKIADQRICPWTALQAWLDASAPLRGDVQRIFATPTIDDSGKIVLVDKINVVSSLKMAEGWPDDDPRYPTKDDFEARCRAIGLASAVKDLRYSLIKWMKFAGVEPESADRALGGHSMRRGLITQLRSAGVEARVVADHVGLVNINLVEEYSDATSATRVLDVLGL